MMGTPRTNRGVWWFFGSDIQLFIIRLIVFAICWYRRFLDLVSSKEAIVFPFKYNLVSVPCGSDQIFCQGEALICDEKLASRIFQNQGNTVPV